MSSSRFNVRFSTGPLTGERYSLGPGDLLFIGSDPSCGIRLEGDPSVSPQHACLHFAPNGKILFKDLGSVYGTRLNGKALTKTARLRPGDRVTIGANATFQGSWWSALQPSRFTQIAALRLSALSRHSQRFASERPRFTLFAAALMLVSVMFLARALFQGGLAARLSESSEPANTTFSGVKMALKARAAAPVYVASADVEGSQDSRFVWDEIVNISRRFGDPPPSALNRGFLTSVETWIERFTRNGAHKALLKRQRLYWPAIEAALRQYNLPIELGYVVWVESGFSPTARSSEGALGLWQMLPETAREYGLRVGGGRDDRLDPQKSSVAAARYFTRLLKMFGSDRYLLALAAYNVGQNRVKRQQIAAAVRRARKADFWQIHGTLPQETADYVPKVLAAIVIARNADRW